MSEYLLLMSIGPVQEFIVQARRMRDLWFGSHVLSEISKAAAERLAAGGATLVFPALDADDKRLTPCNELREQDDTIAINVANKLLAQVSGDPERLAEGAAAAARERLLRWGMEILEARQNLVCTAADGPERSICPAVRASAEEQLETLLRVHAVWTSWDPNNSGSYQQARQVVEDELAARKTLHAFTPWTKQRGGVHKSSFDGSRETVLRQSNRKGRDWRRFRIGAREQLDAIGLLKRTGGAPEQFVPVPNIGLAAWLETAAQRKDAATRKALDMLIQACKPHLPRIKRPESWVHIFPFDAQILLPERWEPYLPEFCIHDATRFGGEHVKPLLDSMPVGPYPYVACIVADGDRMGRAIDALAQEGPSKHRQLSQALARFAEKARVIVEQDHRGILVYAGGDDVLGFTCVQDALACADALRRAFAAVMHEAMDTMSPDNAPEETKPEPPTLSVGVGIGHVLQSLDRLLDLGRRAETRAKHADGGVRNMLGIVLEKHAGTVRTWHGRWDAEPLAALERAMDLLACQRLSHSKIAQLDQLWRRTPTVKEAAQDEQRWSEMVRSEVRRILARTSLADPAATALAPADVDLALDSTDASTDASTYADIRQRLERWLECMYIAVELVRAAQSVKETT